MDDLITLRYFYNLGIEYFRQNQFRMLPPPVPVSFEMAHALPSIGESFTNEEDDGRKLENDFEKKLNVTSSSIENNGNNQPSRQRGTSIGTTKNENNSSAQQKYTYMAKSTNKKMSDQKTSRSRANAENNPSRVSPLLSNKQSTQSTAVDNSNDPAQVWLHKKTYTKKKQQNILFIIITDILRSYASCYKPLSDWSTTVHQHGYLDTTRNMLRTDLRSTSLWNYYDSRRNSCTPSTRNGYA